MCSPDKISVKGSWFDSPGLGVWELCAMHHTVSCPSGLEICCCSKDVTAPTLLTLMHLVYWRCMHASIHCLHCLVFGHKIRNHFHDRLQCNQSLLGVQELVPSLELLQVTILQGRIL